MTQLTSLKNQLPATVGGYNPTDDYLAQRFEQGDRVHYEVVLPIAAVPTILPVPDPDTPEEDNRQVRLNHAQSFADYVRTKDDWHSGPLTIRTTSSTVSFDVLNDYGTMQVGILSVPRNNRAAFRVIDGQHRILGFDLLLNQLNDDLIKAKGRLAAAKRNGEIPEVIGDLEASVEQLQHTLDRIDNDGIAIDLVVEDLQERARQVFVDVANNALGITKAVQNRFDARKVVNRALNVLIESPPALLQDKVDEQNDRPTGKNPNLLGAGSVADIIRIVAKGVVGRVSPAEEKTFDERLMASQASEFFEVAERGFKDLAAIASGKTSPGAVRSTSLIVSTTMLRVMAGVYHNLKTDGADLTEIEDYFRKLDKHMAAPIDESTQSGKLWLKATPKTAAFANGDTAPGACAQQVKELVSTLTEWATTPPAGF